MQSRTKQLTSVFLQTSSLFHRADAHTPALLGPLVCCQPMGLMRNSGPHVCVCVFVRADWLFFSIPTAHESNSPVIYNVSSVRADACSHRPSGARMEFYKCDIWPIASWKQFQRCPQTHQRNFVFPLCVQRTHSDSSSRSRTCSALPSFTPTAAFYVHPNCTVDFIMCCCWTRPS